VPYNPVELTICLSTLVSQASDVFRQAISLLVREQEWGDAVSMLMRFGEACDAAGARHSQAKAYLGAVVVWLYAGDARQAWQVSDLGLALRQRREQWETR
jgi:hypothetical protein